MRSALFWVITLRIVVISYRHFGTTYGSHLQDERNSRANPTFLDFLTLEDGTDRLSRNVGKELQLCAAQ